MDLLEPFVSDVTTIVLHKFMAGPLNAIVHLFTKYRTAITEVGKIIRADDLEQLVSLLKGRFDADKCF